MTAKERELLITVAEVLVMNSDLIDLGTSRMKMRELIDAIETPVQRAKRRGS